MDCGPLRGSVGRALPCGAIDAGLLSPAAAAATAVAAQSLARGRPVLSFRAVTAFACQRGSGCYMRGEVLLGVVILWFGCRLFLQKKVAPTAS